MNKIKPTTILSTIMGNKYLQHGVTGLGIYAILGLRGLIGYVACAALGRMRDQDWDALLDRIWTVFHPWTPLY